MQTSCSSNQTDATGNQELLGIIPSFLSFFFLPFQTSDNASFCIRRCLKETFFSHLNFFYPGSFLSNRQSLHKLSICSGNFKRVLCRTGLKMMKTLWLAKLRKGFLLSSFLLLFPGLAQVKCNSSQSRQMRYPCRPIAKKHYGITWTFYIPSVSVYSGTKNL